MTILEMLEHGNIPGLIAMGVLLLVLVFAVIRVAKSGDAEETPGAGQGATVSSFVSHSVGAPVTAAKAKAVTAAIVAAVSEYQKENPTV